MTDAMLVRRVLGGDTTAFTMLIDRHSPACLRFARRLLGNEQDAEDAAQEAFLRAYRALGRYEEREQFRTWLFQILINRCRTLAGRNARRAQLMLVDTKALERTPAQPPSNGELSDRLSNALAALDDAQREAFLLKYLEELSYDQMSVVTGVRVPALKMRVKRACDRLRDLLEASDA
jgi:RNA polymerase sigma-70 factor (ECF subfamily)